MPVPSKFDLMRRNRDRRRSVTARINAIEAEMEETWRLARAALRAPHQAGGDDTVDWLRDYFAIPRTVEVPLPPWWSLRRWWQRWKWFRRSGRAKSAA